MNRKTRGRKNNNSEEDILTLEEVSGYLKLSRFTVYRMLKDKNIPATRIGGQWRFNKSKIDSWFLNQCITQPNYAFGNTQVIYQG